MKTLLKKIINSVKNTVNKIAIKFQMFKARTRLVLANERGENYVDSGVKILIAVVLGALLLAGLYTLFNDT
ncbi:MAG: DUF6133 family protein, partial [Clostridia bacterium]